MLPKYHVLGGLVFSLLIWAFFPAVGFYGAAVIFLSSFLIDADHYILYAVSQKDFNLKKSYSWCMELGIKYLNLPGKRINKVYVPLCWFHGIEFLTLLAVLGYFFDTALFILVGCLIHLSMDHCRYFYWAIKYPDKHIWKHPFFPAYRFIRTRRFKHISKI